jgi:class 3 adenylate cyclase/pimeloyl-ACP methyl ester carboxylesterase
MDPDIRYARSEGASIAYQVVGEGARDLVFIPDYGSNLVYAWQSPYWRGFYERLARSFRLILFDKRGTGVSDRHGQYATLETRMEDLRAVLDAVDSSEAILLGAHDGCDMAILYAATYPERATALALFHPFTTPDEPNEWERGMLTRVRTAWGTQAFADELLAKICPTLFERGEDDRLWFANWLRVSLSPEFAYALNRASLESDLRPVMSAVKTSTLVLYRPATEDSHYALEAAQRIEGARTVPVTGSDSWGIFLSPEIPEELERFVAGEATPVVPDTVLATVLFTDIVGSTERAAKLGDRAWRELLDRHHALIRRQLTLFRGEEKDTAGDGFFATFDGPARAIRCAQAVITQVRGLGLEIRAGVHTGECEIHDAKVAGIAVPTGARVAALAGPGEVLVSSTVKDLVAGSEIEFEDRGQHELKGVPGDWRLFAVRSA